MKMSVNVQVNLDGEDISRELSHEQATKLILDLDMGVADCDFTENLIIKLMESMRKEFTEQEYNILLEKLK